LLFFYVLKEGVLTVFTLLYLQYTLLDSNNQEKGAGMATTRIITPHISRGQSIAAKHKGADNPLGL
jgi:hypothetical protein